MCTVWFGHDTRNCGIFLNCAPLPTSAGASLFVVGKEKALKRYSLIKTGDPKENSAVAREIMNELRTNQAIGRGHPHIVQYENVRHRENMLGTENATHVSFSEACIILLLLLLLPNLLTF